MSRKPKGAAKVAPISTGKTKKATGTPSTSEAATIAKKLGVKKLYKNEAGEYFTQLDRAMLSVNNDQSKLATLDFSGGYDVAGEVADVAGDADENTENPDQNKQTGPITPADEKQPPEPPVTE